MSPSQADAFAARTEELLLLLSRGRLTLPAGVGIGEFILKDGRVEAAPTPAGREAAGVLPPAAFRDRYLEARSGGSMEDNSLATAVCTTGTCAARSAMRSICSP